MTSMSTSNESTEWDGIAAAQALATPPGDAELGAAYTSMIARLANFLDALASARLAPTEIAEVSSTFDRWLPRLRERTVGERERMWGRWALLQGHGQALVPAIEVIALTESRMRATVRFGEFHGGDNGVVHGGAITLLFDDAAGWLCLRTGAPPSRTAYLNTNFRTPAPVARDLVLEVEMLRVEGRKQFVRAAVSVDGVLCAEAEVLMISLLPGQR